MRDGNCPDCRRLTAGDCGGHYPKVSFSAALPASEALTPPTDATGQGRLLLNEYGRKCYDAGREAERDEWQSWGIVEIAIRNPSVLSYMDHWEKRATKAEATVAALEKALKEERDTWRSSEVAALTAENARLAERCDALEPGARNYNPMRLRAEQAEAALTAQSAALDALEEKLKTDAYKQLARSGGLDLDELIDDLHAARLRGAT